MTSRAAGFRHQGINIWYAEKGAGARTRLAFVFQHGLGGDRRQPLELYAHRAGVHLIAMDCRGHGKTQPLGDPDLLRFATFADDVVALLDHLGVAEFVAGGISMGAGVALNLALRYPARQGPAPGAARLAGAALPAQSRLHGRGGAVDP